jgi:hypothetical protein
MLRTTRLLDFETALVAPEKAGTKLKNRALHTRKNVG